MRALRIIWKRTRTLCIRTLKLLPQPQDLSERTLAMVDGLLPRAALCPRTLPARRAEVLMESPELEFDARSKHVNTYVQSDSCMGRL